MPDRRAQILVLLSSRHDHLPTPTRRADASRGFVHNVDAQTVCPTCDGCDSTMCVGCGGRGYVIVRRRRDPYAVDRVQPYGLDVARHERTRDRDAEIGRLESQLRAPWSSSADELADANMHPYGWERARRAMYAMFDYHALDVALERLHDHLPGVAATSHAGLRMLELLMPDPIRAPELVLVANVQARGRAADPRALRQRDETIRRLTADGLPLGEIAAQVGLSVRQLRRVVNATTIAA